MFDAFLVAAAAIFIASTSYHLGGDATPDFRIYHYYNGFAAASGGRPGDLAAAQLQTYFFPGLDALYYIITSHLDHHQHILRYILSTPYIFAVMALFLIGKIIIPPAWPLRPLWAMIGALFGITGAASWPTLGTAMSDIVPGMFVLFAICSWLFLIDQPARPALRPAAAGLLAGVGVGLKLTCLPLFTGFGLAAVIAECLNRGRWFRFGAVFGIGGIAGILAVSGWFWVHNFETYGNPTFPMMNNIFRSDYISFGSWDDNRRPATLLMALFYPAYWGLVVSHINIELNTRDPRILIGLICCLITIPVLVARLRDRSLDMAARTRFTRFLFIDMFYLFAYVVWEVLTSIYRYLAIVESLTGIVIIISACVFMPRLRWLPAALTAGIFLAAAWSTSYPWWSRSTPAPEAVSVSMPALEPNAMMIFLDPYAYSYLVPSMPRSVRAIGANNNMIAPGALGKLPAEVSAAINGQQGPLWGMEFPKAFPGSADVTLSYYHLHRVAGSCGIVQTNIEDGPHVKLCRLARN